MNNWKETTLDKAVYINPSVSLKRGKEYFFVDMKAIEPVNRCVSESEVREYKGGGSRFMPNDTLMARITPCLENGKIARYVPSDGNSPAYGSTEFIVIRGREGITDNDFAYYLTRCETFRNFAISQMTGSSGRQRVPVDSISNFNLRLPPLPEQKAIAHILGTLDDKIELNRRANKTLEEIARAIFKSWFVDFEFPFDFAQGRPNEKGKPYKSSGGEMIDSEMGEIPKGWKVAELNEIADVIDCLHSKKPERQKYGLPFLQLWNICDNGLIDMTDTYYIDEADYKQWISRMEASPGDCVITNVGRVGAVAQVPEGFKAALGRNMTGIHCKPFLRYRTFLIECLISDAMRNEIITKSDTGTILDAINVRNIPSLRFVLPTEKIINIFEQMVRPLRAKMETNLKQSHTLATLRDTLLPKLLSGEIRVKI